ncbi:GNAT family N-acetyltransferase [Oricola cellulosilytica]|uniref:N-acetyltransferase n=1 Tax=Oricola cellulosilytica TaxID=1429082 RepID=A0A4R0PBS1_9HYPH|nr:N-acetyltransferase [Oricola cellulosilytica]TCD13797.1 N-acetyltransferase [Oricola cellulosilytica]
MILAKTSFRPGRAEDLPGILAVQRRAFGQDAEANLVEKLLADETETLSMVAELDGRIIGHVLLSAVGGPERSLALAPLGVDPDWRDFLIGTELTRTAITAARERGWLSVFVLGDPVYYGRFGFTSALADCVTSPWQGPHLMALELVPGGLFGYRGPLRYPEAFDAL